MKKIIPDLPDKILNEEYKKSILKRTLYIGRISSGIAILILFYFIFQDYNLADFPSEVPLWRIPPLLLAILFYIISFTPLKHYYHSIRIAYQIYLMSLMVMMCGITAVFADHTIFDASVAALIVITFGIFVSSVGGFKFLFPIYTLPFLGFIIYLALFHDLSKLRWLSLSNPLVTIIISLIIAEVYEKQNFREFKSNKIIKDSKEVIEINNKRLSNNMELARQIQEKLIPEAPAEINGTKFYSFYKPMEEIGGDLYDFIFLKESKLIGIFISDVSGHGISAALITGMVKTLVNNAGENRLSPGKFLSYINKKISGQIAGNFLTAFYGIVDTEKKILKYARGGHNFPYLVRNNKVVSLRSKGTLLGLFPEINITEEELQLKKGDKLIFYTDGFIETMNSRFEEFEKQLLNGLLVKYAHLPINEYITTLYNQLVEFHGSSIFDDDICIVGIDI